MKKKTKKISVFKATVLAIVLGGVMSQQVLSVGIPTVDVSGAFILAEQVAAVIKQGEQYAKQI